MAIKHDNIIDKIIMMLSGRGWCLWRLDQGGAWVGAGRKFTEKKTITVNRGDVIVKGGRFLHFGIQAGKGLAAPDMLGYQIVTITEDMVGKNVPVFLLADVKTGTDGLTKEQKLFMEKARTDGVTAEVITENDDDDTIKRKLTFKPIRNRA